MTYFCTDYSLKKISYDEKDDNYGADGGWWYHYYFCTDVYR